MRKKLFSLLLAVAILVGMLPQVALRADAATLAGSYYIAGIRNSGNYFYMSNDLGTASTKRYTAVDSGLTALPESIPEPEASHLFTLVANSDGTYYIKDSAGKYLSYTSGNSGTLSDTPMAVTVEAAADAAGLYNIHFAASDAERYLALNNISSNNYFAWYKSGQKQNLALIPIGGCNHKPSSAGYTCYKNGTHSYTCGSCGETFTENCNVTVTSDMSANCMEYSYKAYACSVCSGTWEDIGTALGSHVWVNDECSFCGLTRSSYVKVTDVTTLKDGDGVVIYYPAGSLLLSATPTTVRLAGVPATVTDDTVAADNGDEVFMIVRIDEEGDYYFETEDGKFLTSGETGGSLSFTDSLTEYSKWYFDTSGTKAPLRIVSRNALFENTGVQAMEYYYGFTTYGINDTAAFSFEIYRRAGYSTHSHSWNEGVVTKPTTCTDSGLKIQTCSTCGETRSVVIPIMGHEYAESDDCENCGLPCIKGQKLTELVHGDTIIIYNPASIMTLTNTPYNTYKNSYLSGMPAINFGEYVLIGAPESILWTVELVDEYECTYRFKTQDGVYLQGTAGVDMANSATLPSEGEPDYSVWQVLDGMYLKNVASGNTLEYYAGRWQTYNYSDYNEDFEILFFTVNAETYCEHLYEKTELSHHTCITDGFNLCICAYCGHRYEENVPATGHVDSNIDSSCDVCGATVENEYWELSTVAPAAGHQYIIATYDAAADQWYALTTEDANAATSAGREVTVSGGRLYNPVEEIMFGARENSYTVDGTEHKGVGFYEPSTGRCLHLNSSKIRVTTSSQNGVFTFNAGTAANSFTLYGVVNAKYLAFEAGNFKVSGTAGAELYFFSKTCEHTARTFEGAYDPTCTESGSTGTVLCAWCGIKLSDPVEIPPMGHSSSYMDNGDGTHDYACDICGTVEIAGEPHTYLEDSDGACLCGAVDAYGPIEDENISFGVNLILDNDLTMMFRLNPNKVAGYDLSTVYLVVERDVYTTGGGVSVEEMTISDYTVEGGRLIFRYPGIAAAQMNDEIRAVLHIQDAEGQEYLSPVMITSVTTYLDGLLKASVASDPKLATLILDMVNYGTAAQIFFDRHTDALAKDSFESFKTYASYASSDLITPLQDLSGQIAVTGASAAISQTLELDTRIGIIYKVKLPTGADVNKSKLMIKDENGNVLETIDLSKGTLDSRGRYVVTFYGSTARDMRRVLYASVTVDGKVVSNTYKYSISSYAYQVDAANQAENLVNVTKAMVIYGDSAVAYFG